MKKPLAAIGILFFALPAISAFTSRKSKDPESSRSCPLNHQALRDADRKKNCNRCCCMMTLEQCDEICTQALPPKMVASAAKACKEAKTAFDKRICRELEDSNRAANSLCIKSCAVKSAAEKQGITIEMRPDNPPDESTHGHQH